MKPHVQADIGIGEVGAKALQAEVAVGRIESSSIPAALSRLDNRDTAFDAFDVLFQLRDGRIIACCRYGQDVAHAGFGLKGQRFFESFC